MHVRISPPSSSTEHEPHCAIPHPSRGPLNFSSLRSTKIRGVSGDADTTCFAPFTVKVSSLVISFSPHKTRLTSQSWDTTLASVTFLLLFPLPSPHAVAASQS